MKRWIQLPILCALATVFVLACDSGGIQDAELSEVTVAEPMSIGEAHNALLREMGVTRHTNGWTQYEFLQSLANAANRVYDDHGASHTLGVDDVSFVLAVARRIDVLYDLHFEDPERADPTAVLDAWLDNRKVTPAEHTQLMGLFEVKSVGDAALAPASVERQPVSELVRRTAEVMGASLEFWTSDAVTGSPDDARAPDDDPPIDKVTIRRIAADALGGAAAGALAAGPILGPLIAGAVSIVFVIDQGCWPDPCGSDSPPTPEPCGGYRGIGPCP